MLGPKSRRALKGVHPDLVRVIERADKDTSLPFMVTEGVRTLARQKELYAAKASKTLNSRHLTGHAVDLAALVGGKVRWDWPLYDRLGEIVLAAAKAEDVDVVWGGSWPGLRDGPHFELSWKTYPLDAASG